MKNLKAITSKIFSDSVLNNTRANKIILSFYSIRNEREITLSVRRKSKSALYSAVEYLNANPNLNRISIEAYFVQKNPWGGESCHHEYSTGLTLDELKSIMDTSRSSPYDYRIQQRSSRYDCR